MNRIIQAVVLSGLLVLGAAPGLAEDEPGWSYQLAHDVMSPFCPGLALSDCPSPDAADLRAWIIEQESAGAVQADVEARLFERFGDQLLQAPRPEGVGLVAYAIPAGGLLMGGLLVAAVLWRRRGSAGPAPAVRSGTSAVPSRAAASDTELEREIDREIGDERH